MKTFNDLMGRAWNLKLDVTAAKRVRDVAGVDLTAMGVGGDQAAKLFNSLRTDLFMVGNTLWALCKPQAEAAGISEEQFATSFDGPVIRLAVAALHDEVALFFDNFLGVDLIGKMNQAADKAVQAAVTQAIKDMEITAPTTSGETSTNQPDVSGSIPDHTPTVS